MLNAIGDHIYNYGASDTTDVFRNCHGKVLNNWNSTHWHTVVGYTLSLCMHNYLLASDGNMTTKYIVSGLVIPLATQYTRYILESVNIVFKYCKIVQHWFKAALAMLNCYSFY